MLEIRGTVRGALSLAAGAIFPDLRPEQNEIKLYGPCTRDGDSRSYVPARFDTMAPDPLPDIQPSTYSNALEIKGMAERKGNDDIQ